MRADCLRLAIHSNAASGIGGVVAIAGTVTTVWSLLNPALRASSTLFPRVVSWWNSSAQILSLLQKVCDLQ